MKTRIMRGILAMTVAGTANASMIAPISASVLPTIEYNTHVQDIGWQNAVANGAVAGTTGQSKRLEGIHIQVKNADYSGGIEYKTHVQDIGWQNYVDDGAMSGTSGQSKRLEAISIKLTGELAKHYDVIYRVHAQNFDWLDWAKNGELSGSATYGYRLEGIQIKLVAKDSVKTEPSKAYRTRKINYRTHVQDVGWQDYSYDGDMSGTSGQSKRLEGIIISLPDMEGLGANGSIEYCTHVQDVGWQNYVRNGAMSGTSGQSKRLEGIRIRLTGDIADKYDVYYRVHAQDYGWLGWAKNGEMAGTSGYAKRLEGIDIELVEKGKAAPGSTLNHCYEKTDVTISNTSLSLISGTTKKITAVTTSLENPIIWTSSNAAVVTVDGNGNIKALKAGTATIKATSGSVSKECKVTVTDNEVTISGNTELYVGKTTPLSAKATNNAPITSWTSSNTQIATVDDKGVVKGIKEGTATITATASDGTAKTVVVRVKKNTVTVSGSTSIIVGANVNLSAVSASGDAITSRTSSNTQIATVDDKGTVKGIKEGTATITATASDGTTGTIAITVAQNTVTITGPEINDLHVGKTAIYTAVSSNGNPIVKWTSNNPDIATIDNNGVATGIKDGVATITATSSDGTVGTYTINVRTYIKITMNSYRVKVNDGSSIQLDAVAEGNAKITWSSSDESIATVDQNGVVTGQRGSGYWYDAANDDLRNEDATCSIEARIGDSFATCIVTVNPKEIKLVEGGKLSDIADNIGYVTYGLSNPIDSPERFWEYIHYCTIDDGASITYTLDVNASQRKMTLRDGTWISWYFDIDKFARYDDPDKQEAIYDVYDELISSKKTTALDYWKKTYVDK